MASSNTVGGRKIVQLLAVTIKLHSPVAGRVRYWHKANLATGARDVCFWYLADIAVKVTPAKGFSGIVIGVS
jgi:hypothetical protein